MQNRLKELIPADEALQIVLSDVSPVGTESVPLGAAAGRILSADLRALRTQPPFDASAMDGYAVRQQDIHSLPSRLSIVGESRAGVPFDGVVGSNEAVRIFTGAVLPKGTDSIVIQENTVRCDHQTVEILSGVEMGKFVRQAGLDFKKDEILLNENTPLSSYRLALAASMDHPTVPVYQKPKVALISTGDELVMPGQTTGPGQIIASNTFGLASSIRNCGATLLDYGIVGDTTEDLSNALGAAQDADADLIVTTGGASVGDHDLVLPVSQASGFEFEIAKIAMRPGKPFLFGRKANTQTTYLTGLAGNPVSSLVAFNVFVKPLIFRLAGRIEEKEQRVLARLGCDLPANDERAEYMRAILSIGTNGERIATPFTRQDSSMLANLVRADCLVFRPVHAKEAKTGESCEIIPIV